MQNSNDFGKITDIIIEKKIIGHAYLIKTSETYCRAYILDFIKKIIKSYEIPNKNKNIMLDEIEKNEYPDLKIIIPNGLQIKKDQIKNLESDFKTAANEGQKRFYIIEFAENLNDSSANALLKFLEEPETDIVAFLVTKNINMVKSTLISRCQILNCNESLTDNYSDEEIINKSLEFLKLLKIKKIKATPYFCEYYEIDINDINKIFTTSINILYDIINHIYGLDLDFAFFNKKTEIIEMSKNIETEIIIKMINAIEDSINLLKGNMNIKLIFDKLIFDIYGVDKNV